jgi:hypothetical protein
MNRIRLAALVATVGLVAVGASLQRPHTYSFLLFLMVGVPATIIGAALFVFAPRR